MRLFASIIKELLLLSRDKAGITLLFIMPAFLVIIITLIQDQVTSTTANVLYINEDHGEVAQEIGKLLSGAASLNLITSINNQPITSLQAHKEVANGSYHFSIIIPEKLSEQVKKRGEYQAQKHLFPQSTNAPAPEVPAITLWFDPTVQGSFKSAVSSSLKGVVEGIEAKQTIEHIFALLPKKITASLPAGMEAYIPDTAFENAFEVPDIFNNNSFIGVEEKFATEMGFSIQPSAVQQNVPAWTIFGIFFIVLPLAGSIINERESGTLLRLKVMPVSYTTVLAGKLVAFGLVSLVQFIIIFLASQYILPLFGIEAFDPGSNLIAFFMVLLAVIIAANGYGILLGTLCKTYEQVSMLAPVSIVIAAAFGGILVPVYALPDFLRPLSIISPLYWGQSGFNDLLLRQGDIFSILPEVTTLVVFGLLLCIIAMVYNRIRH